MGSHRLGRAGRWARGLGGAAGAWQLKFAVDARDLYSELYKQAAEEAQADTLGWLAAAGYGYQALREENAAKVRTMSWLSGALGVPRKQKRGACLSGLTAGSGPRPPEARRSGLLRSRWRASDEDQLLPVVVEIHSGQRHEERTNRGVEPVALLPADGVRDEPNGVAFAFSRPIDRDQQARREVLLAVGALKVRSDRVVVDLLEILDELGLVSGSVWDRVALIEVLRQSGELTTCVCLPLSTVSHSIQIALPSMVSNS